MSESTAMTKFPAPARWTSSGVRRTYSADQLAEALAKPELWPASSTVRESAGLLPGWSFAEFADDARVTGQDEQVAARESEARAERLTGVAVDYLDDPTVDETHIAQWWHGFRFVAYTTAFHQVPQGERPAGPRWRVLLGLSRAVSIDEGRLLAAWARHPRREAGMVAKTALDVCRVFPVPAISPGGYSSTQGAGPLLDPDAAIQELEAWTREDVEREARADLAGCLLDEAVQAFVVARTDGAQPERFDWAGTQSEPPLLTTSLHADECPLGLPSLSVLGPLWPGRLVLLVGTAGSGRTALALQTAAAVAAAGQPVLYVSLDVGVDEMVARLLALRSEQAVAYRDVLLARHDAENLETACASLVESLKSLHIWAPRHAERTGDALVERVKSLRRASHGRAPLVILDPVDDWQDSGAAHPLGELFGALRDVARPGCLGADWPGAAVIALSGVRQDLATAFAQADPTAERWQDALSSSVEAGPTREAALLLGLISRERSEGSEVRATTLVAAKNRHGRAAVLSFDFNARRGRFSEPADPPQR
ncbi:MAG: AAA family ATPase [Proteobacteria bacterium]|nr:AAA family ATPase [Pseudomonadota bacterium]